MNTDPQSPAYLEIRDFPTAAAVPESWEPITAEQAEILRATPPANRMARLGELRGDLSHNQRKQTLKRRGLR